MRRGGELVCSGVSVSLSGTPILHEVDLAVAAGEWLALIGPNGSGKTTLLRAVVGLVEHRGTVSVAGSVAPTAADVALVPQAPLLPHDMTVSEYVLLGRTAHLGWFARESRRDRAIVAAVLERLELGGFADRMVTSLSGGEAQRAVIARALAQQTSVLLLDEPTSALDVGHQEAVLELLDGLRRCDGLTVVTALHDLTLAARFADRLALLERGRIVATGGPGEVLEPGLLSAVYATPLQVRDLDGELVVLSARSRRTADR